MTPTDRRLLRADNDLHSLIHAPIVLQPAIDVRSGVGPRASATLMADARKLGDTHGDGAQTLQHY